MHQIQIRFIVVYRYNLYFVYSIKRKNGWCVRKHTHYERIKINCLQLCDKWLLLLLTLFFYLYHKIEKKYVQNCIGYLSTVTFVCVTKSTTYFMFLWKFIYVWIWMKNKVREKWEEISKAENIKEERSLTRVVLIEIVFWEPKAQF